MSATNGFSFGSVSSMEMPITCRPSLPYLFWNSMNHGISILHGPHHVAQKSSRITLPLNDESFTFWFERSFSEKSRLAAFALAGHATVPGVAPLENDSVGSGRSALSVSSASANALTEAAPQRRTIIMSVYLSEARTSVAT